MADSRTGLVGLALGGGAAALAILALVILGVRALSGDPPRAAEVATSRGAEVALEGMHGRGTAELQGIGCATAIVMDMTHVLGDAAVRQGEPRFVVTCDVTSGTPPSCERAAATYFTALGGSAGGNVNVRVSRSGTARPVCSHLYAPSGADFGEYPRVN